MKIKHILESTRQDQEKLLEILQVFFPFAVDYLQLKTFPKIRPVGQVSSPDQPTFGRFLNQDEAIELAINNRHPIDVLRTLAHELVHYRQHINGQLDKNSGITGSPEENEANQEAGIILRMFNKKHPEFFKSLPVVVESQNSSVEEGELIPWPKGTVKVDVSDVYDWYKLGQHISNLKGLGKHDFGKGPPQTVMAFGSEPLEHEYIKDLNKIGLKTYDIDENFADGKNPGRKGLSRRVGIPKKATLAQLEKIAKNSTGERRRMAQWQLNMRRGRARKELDEASTTLQQSRATSQTMKTARNIDYSPALQKNVEAVILAAHQKLQLPHDLNWMNLPPLDGLVGMDIFTDENLRKIWAYHRDPDQYTGTMVDKNKLASLAFLIKGPVGAVVMVATPDYNMRIPRKFEMSAAYINLGDGTLKTVRDVTKTKILPVIKAATGKVNVRSGEILVADIRQKHTGKISQRQQRSQASKQDTESTTVAYRKIYRLVPGILRQVEADIMGNVQSLIKNKSYERAKQKIERLDTIRNLEDNITADSSNYYLMRSNDLALYMTASHLFPEQTGEITRSYGGYGVEDTKGVERVVALIANNDRPTLSMFLAFFKRALLLI